MVFKYKTLELPNNQFAKQAYYNLLKKALFTKGTMVMRFPTKKTWHYPPPPVGLPGNSPPLPPESVRADGRTLTSKPKFLGSIGYQISSPMVHRSAAFGRQGAPL